MSQTRTVVLLLLGLAVLAGPGGADHIPVLNEDAKLLASDGKAGDWFGERVAIDGDRIVVGAQQDDDLAERSGAIYVFDRSETGAWLETVKLVASDGDARDNFGTSVDLQADTIVVAAQVDDDLGEDSGSVYVFELTEQGLWLETAKLLASDGAAVDHFGEGVAINGDTIVVGAKRHGDLGVESGAVYVFERTQGGSWSETAKLLAPDGEEFDIFGGSVALDGNRLVVGAQGDDDRASNAGAAYVFERTEEGDWEASAKLLASDGEESDIFGALVALDGDIVAVSATNDDDQDTGSGAAYVFERSEEGMWVETAKLLSPHPQLIGSFGRPAVSGDTIAVGAPGFLLPGTVDLFQRGRSGKWVNSVRLFASDSLILNGYARRVAIDGGTVVVAAPFVDNLGTDAGAVYVFSLENSVLTIRLDPVEVLAGEELLVSLSLRHNRPETVTVSFRLWIEDAAGSVVASRTTPPVTLRQGDTLNQTLTALIPLGTPPGGYVAKVDAAGMQPWLTGAMQQFQVVKPVGLSSPQ